MIRRPGILSNRNKFSPKRKTIKFNSLNGFESYLGTFGKGVFIPPPSPPPGGSPGMTPLPGAIDKRTGQYYMQDPKCPEGEITDTRNVPCVGQECCDGGDCDPEGTIYPETDCFEDPNYQELPEEPPEGFQSCEARRSARYPDPCNEQTCPSCFKSVQTTTSTSAASADDDIETARLAAELQKVEAEHAKVKATVSQSPMLAPASAYTGGSIPTGSRREPASTESEESRIASLVSEHETQKALHRTAAPPPIIPQAPLSTAIAPKKEGFFSWLKNSLFGSSPSLDGWGFGEFNVKTSVIPIIIIISLIYLYKQPGKRKKKK